GQGSVEVTVLQLATAYAAIANGGKLWVPQVVNRIERAGGQIVESFPPRLRRTLSESNDALVRIRRALTDAVNDPKGTAYAARVVGLSVAGKTGTAQVQRLQQHDRHRDEEEGAIGNDHAWFASFAPADKPEIAVVVFVEHGGFGAKAAAPTAM